MADVSAALAGTVRLGNLTLNRIGLGTNRTSPERSPVILKTAVQLGINLIDTAQLYGQSQKVIGETLSPYPEGVVIATKGGYESNNKESLAEAIDESLRLLRLESLPFWQLHRVQPDNPLENTMRFLKYQMVDGRIQNIGLSEVTVEQIAAARKVVPIVSVQNHYNLETREYEAVVDYCTRENIAFMPFFPLSSGGAASNPKLQELSQKYDATPIQIAIAWLLKRSPMMLPIPGTLSPDHLKENLAAAKIELSDQDFQSL